MAESSEKDVEIDAKTPMINESGGQTLPLDPAPTHPVASPEPAPASPIQGYRQKKQIAEGGMGIVYSAECLTFGREVAVKVMKPGMSVATFNREARITAQLPHPGIPPVHAMGVFPNGIPYLVMKLICGETLESIIKKNEANLAAARGQLVAIFEHICQAVGYAHSRGIIHRDLKPSNVMVGAFGEVQVMDWGLAKEKRAKDESVVPIPAGSPGMSQAGQIKGTPAYMSPEQARGEEVDSRADVFALGGILLAILTGRPPFQGRNAYDTVGRAARCDLGETQERLEKSGADADLVSLCRKCLSADPLERPADGEALAAAVSGYRIGVEERLRQAELAQVRAQELRKRRRVKWLLTIVLLVCLTVGATAFGLVTQGYNRQLTISEKNAKENEKMAIEAVKAFADKVARDPDLKNRKELGGLRRELLKTPLIFFEKLDDKLRSESSRNRENQWDLAMGLKELGFLSNEIGDKAKAAESYKRAGDILVTMNLEQAGSSLETLEHAKILSNLGAIRRETGQAGESSKALKDALEVLENGRFDAADTTSAKRLLVALCLNSSVSAMADPSAGDPFAWATRAKKAAEDLKDSGQRSMEDAVMLARVNNVLGAVASEKKQWEQAEDSHRQAMNALGEWTNESSIEKNLEWLRTKANLAGVASAKGDSKLAMAALREVANQAEKWSDEAYSSNDLAYTCAKIFSSLYFLECACNEKSSGATCAKAKIFWDRYSATNPSVIQARIERFLTIYNPFIERGGIHDGLAPSVLLEIEAQAKDIGSQAHTCPYLHLPFAIACESVGRNLMGVPENSSKGVEFLRIAGDQFELLLNQSPSAPSHGKAPGVGGVNDSSFLNNWEAGFKGFHGAVVLRSGDGSSINPIAVKAAEIHKDIGNYHLRNQQVAEAIPRYALAIRALEKAGGGKIPDECFRDFKSAINNHCWLSLTGMKTRDIKSGDISKLVELCDRNLRLNPTDPDYAEALALALYRSGQFDNSLRSALDAVQLWQNKGQKVSPYTLAMVAMCQWKLGNKEQSRKSLNEFRESLKDPQFGKDPDAQNFLKEAEELIIGARPTNPGG